MPTMPEWRALAALASQADKDFANHPTVRFYGALRAALIERGFSSALAERTAAAVDAYIARGALSRDGVYVAAGTAADTLVNFRRALQAEGFVEHTDEVLLSLASQLFKVHFEKP